MDLFLLVLNSRLGKSRSSPRTFAKPRASKRSPRNVCPRPPQDTGDTDAGAGKHVRACIVYTWDHKSSASFWQGMKVYVRDDGVSDYPSTILTAGQAANPRRRGADVQSAHYRSQGPPRRSSYRAQGGAVEHQLARELVARLYGRRGHARICAAHFRVHLLPHG
jgi:hypothetical protein